MSTIDQEVSFSFLTTGPTMRFQLPAGFHPMPKLNSPLLIRYYSGARSFYFIPNAFRQAGHSLVPLHTRTDGEGRRVDVYQRSEPPPQWWIRWELRAGYVTTFLTEEDGIESADTEIESLRIAERSSDGMPFLLPEKPLRMAASAQIGYGERASFQTLAGDAAISLRRPGFLPEGRAMKRRDSSGLFLRAGAKFGCEVGVFAGPDELRAQQLLETVQATLEEAS